MSIDLTGDAPAAGARGHRGTRLRADAERNRIRILEAAAEVFARRGLEAGLDEVARHAGVGVGTVYRRFPDKAMLVDALFEHRFEHLIELAEEAAAQDDAWAAFAGFVERAIAAQVADRALNELLLSEANVHALHAKKRLMPLMEALVERTKESGDLRPDVTMTDLATIQMAIQAAAAIGGDVAPEHWRRTLTVALDGLRTRREGPAPLPGEPLSAAEFEAACRQMACPAALRPPARS